MITIIKNEGQVVVGLSTTQRSELKDKLTFENPEYETAKSYSKSGYVSVKPFLTYYTETSEVDEKRVRKSYLQVPIGVPLPDLFSKTEIEYIDKRCFGDTRRNFPKFLLDLRPDQAVAKKAYFDSLANDSYPRGIISLPTGKGKTILALNIAYELQQKTLVLVGKEDLLVGWQKDIKTCFGGKASVGVIQGKKKVVGEHFTIAMVQTLSRMSSDELKAYTNQFGLVVQDEVHHVGINIFNIVSQFNSFYKVGLSATPFREDGLDFVFDLFFGGIVYKHIVKEDDEDISNVEVIVKNSNSRFKPFVYEGRIFNYWDYKEEDLPSKYELLQDIPYADRPSIPFVEVEKHTVSNSRYVIQVCKDIITEYKAGRSIIVMFNTKEHLEYYNMYLNNFIPRDQIIRFYGDSNMSSQEMIDLAESRKVLVTLATYSKAKEGTNVKSWEVLVLASSTSNKKTVEQASGRIRRRKEGKIEPVIIYDYNMKDCYTVSSHYAKRKKVYKDLKFKIRDLTHNSTKGSKKKGSMFSRGY